MLIPLRGGGKKLLKKILNKYNLGGDYKEIKNKVENSSSSGDSNGGDKKYWYYKNINAMFASYNSRLPIIRTIGISIPVEIFGKMHSYGERAICIPDEECTVMNSNVLGADYTTFPKGDLYEKVKNTDISVDAMKSAYKEITEEEYYSYLNN